MSAATRATTAKERARIAAGFIRRSSTTGRAFSDCFEMGDGDEVKRLLLEMGERSQSFGEALCRQCPTWYEEHPATDYRGAHVLDPNGRLATITAGRWEDHGGTGYRADLRRFDGSSAGTYRLADLRILPRY